MQSSNTLKIEISAVQALSYASVCEGFSPVFSVCVEGLALGKRHDVSLCIYGIGKNGFFIERTLLFSRRIYAYDVADGVGRLCFDLSCEKLRIKKGFFENLKSFSSGSIYAELTVDGKKHLAQKSVDLIPKATYSPVQSPSVLAYFLYPHTELTDRITKSCGNSFEKLFDAVKGLGFIYSSRNGEDGYGNYNLRIADELCLSGTKVAGALEVALFFASCAISCRLYPSLCVTEKGSKHKLLCGLSHSKILDDGICDKKSELFKKTSSMENPPVFFDITSLFAGYNVDFFAACKNGVNVMADENLLFFTDLIPCLEGKYPPAYDGVSEKKMIATLDALRSDEPPAKTIDSISLELEKDINALLNFDINSKDSLHLCLSSLSVADKLARYTIPVHIKSVKGSLDEERVAPLSAGICSLLSSGKNAELNNAEANDIFSALAGFKHLLCKSEEEFILSTLLSEEELLCRIENISNSGSIYIACGFFKILGKLAPVALFPVTSDGSDITFTDTVPFANKLLAQHIISGIGLDDFYKKFSLPEGSCESIVSYFENLALQINLSAGKKICEVIRECALSTFSVASCRLLSSLCEERDTIGSDPLVKALVSGERLADSPDPDSLFSVYASKIAQLEQTSPALCDTHLAAVAASGDNDILIAADNGCGITDTVFATACENLRLGKKTLIVCPEEADLPRALKNKFERANLACALLTLTGGKSVKSEISKKLRELKDVSPSYAEKAPEDTFTKSRLSLCDVYRKDSKIYPFGKSLYNLILEHEAHSAYLSEEEKEIHILPEGLYLPDMSREEYEGLFEKVRKLCEAAYELCPSGEPLSEHPLICVKRTSPLSDTSGFMSLYENASLYLVKLRTLCEGVISASGMTMADVQSLSSLFSYISLVLTVMTEYNTEAVQPLLHCDIYALAKKVDNAKAMLQNGQAEDTGADLRELLCDIKRLLPTISDITVHDLERMSGAISFIKSADIHAKKIFGTDSQKRAILFSRFYDIYGYCNSNKEEIIRITECFEKLFDEKHGYAVGIYSLMKADIYGAHFEDGILEEDGMYGLIKGWKDNITSLSDIVSYNVAEEGCEESGLSLFAKYIKEEGVSPSTPHIFARSLTFLAANQIKSRDKSSHDTELSRELEVFANAQKAQSISSLYELSQIHVSSCAKYINSNISKVGAFSDSLSDSSVGAHSILKRYCEIIKGIFPIVFAHPEYAACLDGFENVIFLGSDRMPLEKALPLIPRASHRMICAQLLPGDCGCLAYAAKETGVCTLSFNDVSYKYDSAIRSYFDSSSYCVRHSGAPKIRRLVPDSSSYDNETGTNLSEALNICFDVSELLDGGFTGTIGVTSLSESQTELIKYLIHTATKDHVSLKSATDSGALSVFSAERFCPDSFDVLYVSTLYAPSEDGRMPYFYGAISSKKRVADVIRKAVSCARKELVVASSLYENDISGYAQNTAEWQILRLCEFAQNKCPYIIPEIHTDVLCESLCDILCERGYDARPIRSGIGALVEHGGVTYAVYCEKADSHTTFDREASLRDKLLSCGYSPVPVRAQDIMLNKEKVAQDFEKFIKKEKTVI